jgi:hypothetical protein
MEEQPRKGFPFAKIVTWLAIAFGVALGLCGLNLVLAAGMGAMRTPAGSMAMPIVTVLGLGGLVVMLITGPLLLITVVAWVITSAIGGRGARGPHKRFDDNQDKLS